MISTTAPNMLNQVMLQPLIGRLTFDEFMLCNQCLYLRHTLSGEILGLVAPSYSSIGSPRSRSYFIPMLCKMIIHLTMYFKSSRHQIFAGPLIMAYFPNPTHAMGRFSPEPMVAIDWRRTTSG
jgi:hypothetical protein